MEQEQKHEKHRDKDKDRGTENGKRALIVPGDPPILVGGGGSTVVWIRNNVFQPELNAAQRDALLAANPDMPRPEHPDRYHVFACNFDTEGATVKSDASMRSVRHNTVDAIRHHTIFHPA